MVKEQELLKSLQGRWQAVYSELEGQMTPPDEFASIVMEYRGNDFFVEKNGEIAHTGSVSINMDSSPPEMHFKYTKSPTFAGKSRAASFQVVGDTLKTNAASPEQPAPKDFNTLPEAPRVLTVFQRLGGDGVVFNRTISRLRSISQW